MIVKVKEPQPQEWAQLRPGQILFTYLHLAADPEQARGLMAFRRHRGRLRDRHRRPRRPAAACADERGRRPPVDPGRGDRAAEAEWRPRRAPRRRARRAAGQGRRHRRRRRRHRRPRAWPSASAPTSPSSTSRCRASAPSTIIFRGRVRTRYSTREALAEEVCSRRRRDRRRAGPRRHGAEARHPRDARARMKPGAVLVDVAIDQGGCFETSHADHPCRADLSSSTASSTTASPTCRAPCR